MTHAQRYAALTALTKREDHLDSSYSAAFYLLATDKTLYESIRPYISRDGVDFAAAKRKCGDLDYIQQNLFSIAQNLFSWTSKCPVTPHELACLGYPALDHAGNALFIASGMIRVQVRENGTGQPELLLDKSRYEQNRLIQQQFSALAGWPEDEEESDMEIG